MVTTSNNPPLSGAPNEDAQREQARRLAERYRCPFVDLREQRIDPDFGERWRMWGAFRAMSVPQSGDMTISDTAGNFVANVAAVKAKDAARVFDVIGGVEVRIAGNNALLPSFDRQTKQKFTLSLIAGYGFVTPTTPQDEIKVFKVFKDAPGLPPEAKDKEFVAFVPNDRDRFFRQYYGGIRLQTFFFNRYNVPIQRFPAQLDFTVRKEVLFGDHTYLSGITRTLSDHFE